MGERDSQVLGGVATRDGIKKLRMETMEEIEKLSRRVYNLIDSGQQA